MDGRTPASRFRENASGIAATVVTGVWLAAMFLGFDWWLAVLLFGYVVVVPVVAMLFDEDGKHGPEDWWDDTWDAVRDFERGDEPSRARDETPLEALRRRYAEGELTDEQFERKLERLLETETLEDVEERAARDRLREHDP